MRVAQPIRDARALGAENARRPRRPDISALPIGRVAATEVVTDLLIFRRRAPTVAVNLNELDWINTEPVDLVDPSSGAQDQVPVNTYFINNPHRVLGAMELGPRPARLCPTGRQRIHRPRPGRAAW
jgi:hypothetical protein